MPDRAWEHGLHQMIEAKEGLDLTGTRETLARITYQRLFRRYLRLAGMSGTVTEVAAEIGRTYGLPVVRVPLHRPSRRSGGDARCLADADSKWQAVVDAIERVAVQERRPVLVGTRTVKASEDLAALLAARGIDHVVLNAKQDRDEALIIARAGEAGRVTVATNMAGRGTDIVLGAGVAERGGLHVILTEYHESRRIDRQLFGRSARQGDPGSGEAIVALDDELFVTQAPRLVRRLARRAAGGQPVAPLALALLRRAAQAVAEARNRDAREATLKQDRRFARVLAFAGRGE
jgi:preprotein translocase subunit SecA